jgi:hypothetical protein
LVGNGIIDFINITRNKRDFDYWNWIWSIQMSFCSLSTPITAPLSPLGNNTAS